jgi:hypothetical protein
VIIVWAALFTTFMASFASWLVVQGLVADPSTDRDMSIGALIVIACFVVLPIAYVVAMVRSGVRSVGPTLRVRNWLSTRTLPVDDIDDFVWVGMYGHRRSTWLCRPAVALRRGSVSDVRDSWSDRSAVARRVRRVGFRFVRRQVGDIPISCIPPSLFSRRRGDRALAELRAWHEWAAAVAPA